METVLSLVFLLLAPALITGNRAESRGMEAEGYIMLAEQIIKENNKVSLRNLKTSNEIYDLAEKLFDAKDYLSQVDLAEVPVRLRGILHSRFVAANLGIMAREEMLRARMIEITKAENYKTANLAIVKSKMILRKNASIPVKRVGSIRLVEMLMDNLHEIEKYLMAVKIDELSRNYLKKYEEEVRVLRLGAAARRDELVARYWEIMDNRAEVRKAT